MATRKSTKSSAATRSARPRRHQGARPGAPRGGVTRATATRKSAARRSPVLLSGGNPQIAKADGDAPVRAYLAALTGWKRDVARRLDALVPRAVPNVRRAVKWNSPFYGIEGRGWFLSFHVFTRAIKVTFFRGTSLLPAPPGGKSREARWIDVHENDLDEAQLTRWMRQAAALPGWDASSRGSAEGTR